MFSKKWVDCFILQPIIIAYNAVVQLRFIFFFSHISSNTLQQVLLIEVCEFDVLYCASFDMYFDLFSTFISGKTLDSLYHPRALVGHISWNIHLTWDIHEALRNARI